MATHKPHLLNSALLTGRVGRIMGQGQSEPEQNQEADNSETRLYNVPRKKWPIVYSTEYDVSAWGLEGIHPFDSSKWRKVFDMLVERGMLSGLDDVVQPLEINRTELLRVHDEAYLDSLNTSANVAMVIEVPPAALVPNFLMQKKVLRPFRHQTGGTILAGKLATERGWAINIGGGFHHCCASEGGGFCVYADITLAVKFLLNHVEAISKVMIVDFDAHQGNGYARDFLGDDKVFIVDMYNRWIYPNDIRAKAAIDVKIELDVHTGDETYIGHIERKLPEALDRFKPDIVVYNAGTDVLMGDPLGIMDITDQGVIRRDELVFKFIRQRRIPIFMLTSGGYQKNNAQVIAASIHNLHEKQYISASDLEGEEQPVRTMLEQNNTPDHT